MGIGVERLLWPVVCACMAASRVVGIRRIWLGRFGTNKNIGPPAERVNVSFLPLAALYENLTNKTEGSVSFKQVCAKPGCGQGRVPPAQNLQRSMGGPS